MENLKQKYKNVLIELKTLINSENIFELGYYICHLNSMEKDHDLRKHFKNILKVLPEKYPDLLEKMIKNDVVKHGSHTYTSFAPFDTYEVDMRLELLEKIINELK